MDLGLGAVGDLSSITTESDDISIPGEGEVGQDEMVALRQPTPLALQQQQNPRPQPLLSKSKALLQAMPEGASLEGSSEPVSQTVPKVAAPVEPKAKVLEEYDVSPESEQTDEEAEHEDDYRTTKMDEVKTAEEEERVERGDVEKVKPVEHKKPVEIELKKPTLKLAAESQQHSKVAVKEVDIAEQAPGQDKQMAQCMAFAGWVKSQGSTGPDLVRIWKGTCMPAVMAGSAPPPFSNMCNALGTAVSKFSVGPWAPADMCTAVLAVFRESGVGATPLRR